MGAGIVFEDKTMKNTRPPFSLKFTEDPIKINKKGAWREFLFAKDSRPIVAGYHRSISAATPDYYETLSYIAGMIDYKYIKSVRFADHEWAKIAKYNNREETLYCGYLTRKDNDLILVFSVSNDIRGKTQWKFDDFTQTQEMSDTINKEIDSQFEHLDNMVTIIY